MTRQRSTTVRAAPRYDPTPDLSAYLPVELEWHRDALCAQTDPDAYYPLPRMDKQAAQARAICAACPVRATCLDWAIDNSEQWGIWGGMTYRQRLREQARHARTARGAVAA